MKKIFAALLALVSSVAFGTTLVPIQLLNPAGSVAGQMIMSTGASSAPSWSSTLPSLTLSNTNTGGVTFTISSTSNTSAGASMLLTGNGATTPSKYLGVLNGSFYILNNAGSTQIFSLTDAGNAVFTGSVQPSQTGGIIGTTTSNNANAGSVGEFLTATTSGVSLTNSTAANCASQSLTAGDYEVSGTVLYNPGATTTMTGFTQGVGTTSAGFSGGGTYTQYSLNFITGQGQAFSTPVIRVSLSSTTTVYLVGYAAFAASTMTCTGYLHIRRVR